MKKIIILIVVILILIAGAWYASSYSKNGTENLVADPVATVNGEAISRSDLELVKSQVAISQNLDIVALNADQLAKLETDSLDTLISQVLLRQAAEKAGMTATQADIDTQIGLLKDQFESEEAYTAELVSKNMTEQLLRTNIEKQLIVQAYLTQTLNLNSLTATEAEITEAYNTAIQGAEDAPTLKASYDQISSYVVNQKQQVLISQLIQELRATAEIKTLI